MLDFLVEAMVVCYLSMCTLCESPVLFQYFADAFSPPLNVVRPMSIPEANSRAGSRQPPVPLLLSSTFDHRNHD